jgi:AraC family transcriptional regulator, positive regulator of tynA and feaB
MYGANLDSDRAVTDPSQWATQIRQNFFPLSLTPSPRMPFAAEAAMASYGRCRVAQIRTSAHTASVGSQTCKNLARRYVKIIWQLDGQARFEQGAHDAVIPAGYFMIYEASRPYRIQMDTESRFVAMLSEVADHDTLLGLSQRLGGQPMPTTGAAAVALVNLQMMVSEAGQMTPRSRFTILDTVTTLLGEHGECMREADRAVRWRNNDALLREAHHHIYLNIGDSDLSPDRIAKALNVCRRTLYHAFASVGESPQAMIQRVRLERCRELLSQKESEDISITRLALQFGFSDPAYFTRLFRQKFGEPPSQYRAMVMREATSRSQRQVESNLVVDL